MAGDPELYSGSAAHYLPGRPPYAAGLLDALVDELDLDGHGTLVDVGCGPGALAVALSPAFDRVIGIDPDRAMLREAVRHAGAAGRPGIEWHQAYAEDIGGLGLPSARVVTFGQSFHWTDRAVVAAAVHELLAPGGSLVLVTHDIDAGPAPGGTGDPEIPDEDVQDLIAHYLGPGYRDRHRARRWDPTDRYEPALAATVFGRARTVHVGGREDHTRDIDGVVSGYLSMSYAAPARFGADLDRFVADLRALLAERTTTGRFWDWPGDTALIIATKPG